MAKDLSSEDVVQLISALSEKLSRNHYPSSELFVNIATTPRSLTIKVPGVSEFYQARGVADVIQPELTSAFGRTNLKFDAKTGNIILEQNLRAASASVGK